MKSDALADDIRWHRLRRRQVRCLGCGEVHAGLADLASSAPEVWPGPAEPEPNGAVLSKDHLLTEDFCILHGQHYFVRCVLEIPIIGTDERFGYGVWSTLSERNYKLYLDTFDSGEQDGLGPWFGWFSNRLKGYPDSLSLKCQVHPRSGRQRPRIELEPTDHPLAVEQREGISFDRLLQLFALNGHDLGLGPAESNQP